MKHLFCICPVIALLGAVGAAPAMAITGNELKEWADSGEKGSPGDHGFVRGYIAGVLDTTDTDIPKVHP